MGAEGNGASGDREETVEPPAPSPLIGLGALLFLFACVSAIQGALLYVSFWLPRLTAAFQVVSTGVPISLGLWAIVETQKLGTARSILVVARHRAFVVAACASALVLVVAFFVHPVRLACGVDAAISMEGDTTTLLCHQGSMATSIRFGTPVDRVTFREGSESGGPRASAELGFLVATTIHHPGDFVIPAMAVIVLDPEALALVSGQSPFTFELAGRTGHVPKEGLLVGGSGLHGALLSAYREKVKEGEPLVVDVGLVAGQRTLVSVAYRGKPCAPVDIDPSVRDIWVLTFDSCSRSP